jgi:hypothetical protein
MTNDNDRRAEIEGRVMANNTFRCAEKFKPGREERFAVTLARIVMLLEGIAFGIGIIALLLTVALLTH